MSDAIRSHSSAVNTRSAITRQTTPRSRRVTASSPQRRAMSVALLDHSEIVPNRGTTTKVRASEDIGGGGAP